MSKDMARRTQPTVFKFLSLRVFNTYEGARTMNCEDRYQDTDERFPREFHNSKRRLQVLLQVLLVD